MIGAGLAALLSHWRRHPFQLLTLILGLATATALWSGVQAINAEARASYDRAATTLAGPPRDTLVPRSGETLPLARFVELRRAGWPVSPLLEGSIDGPSGPVRLLGVEPFSLPPADLPFETDDTPGAAATDFFTGAGQIRAAPETVAALRGLTGLPPLVADNDIAPGIAYADILTAGRILGQEGRASRLVLTGDPTLIAPPLEEIAPELVRRAPGDEGPDIARLTDSFHLNLTAFGLLSFAVGLFIVRGAIGLAFEQRRPVFRTLRALGVPRRLLVALLAGELFLLATFAGTIGVALGWLVATLLLPDVAATLRGLYGASVAGSLSLRPVWWLTGLAIAVAGTGVAAAGSLWQVYRLPLLAPAQPRAWARASVVAMRWQAGAALALAVSGLAAGATGGLLAGFALLGALLVAAALLLPLALHLALSALSRLSQDVVSDWFWADTRQQLPGLSLALMALLLALAANIGVGTMVSSFRLTFTGWLDQRLAAELYVTAEDADQVPALLAFLEPRTDAILPIRSVEAAIAGRPGEIYGVADHPTYTRNWPLIAASPDVWPKVAAGEAVLINEQLARARDLWPGDSIALPGWQAPIAGIYSDYGNPSPQALMGLARFDAMYPEAERLRYGLRLDPQDAAALKTALTDEFGLPADNLVDQAALKQLSLGVFERTFTVTAALNVLTLSVAGFAILTSLLTLATMRQPQLAPVWALGLTRKGLAGLELARAVLLAGLTFIAALPVGLLLAWVLLAVINVEAFGWRLPMHVFPGDWATLFGLSLVAAVAASLLPALRLTRLPPAELLKVFAHER